MNSAPFTEGAHDHPTNLNASFPADNAHAFDLRQLLRGWCTLHHVPSEACDDVLLVATELFTNGVSAARPGSVVAVSVALQDAMILTVANDGTPFEIESLSPPSVDQVGGRGLLITQAIGTLSVSHDAGTTTVSAALPLARPVTQSV